MDYRQYHDAIAHLLGEQPRDTVQSTPTWDYLALREYASPSLPGLELRQEFVYAGPPEALRLQGCVVGLYQDGQLVPMPEPPSGPAEGGIA